MPAAWLSVIIFISKNYRKNYASLWNIFWCRELLFEFLYLFSVFRNISAKDSVFCTNSVLIMDQVETQVKCNLFNKKYLKNQNT